MARKKLRASFLFTTWMDGRMDDGTPAWQQNTSRKCSMTGGLGSALFWASSSTGATSKTPPRQRTNYCSTAPMHRCTDVLGLAFHSGIFHSHQGGKANARSRTESGSKGAEAKSRSTNGGGDGGEWSQATMAARPVSSSRPHEKCCACLMDS